MTDEQTQATAPTEQQESVASRTYKCASCGNFLRYDPIGKNLKCAHCGATQELHECPPAQELTYTADSEVQYEPWGATKTIRCEDCGAVTALSEFETATKCPFCGAPHIVELDDMAGLKPNAILPFAVDETSAYDAYKKWMKRKLFAPMRLNKLAKRSDAHGIYIPMFTFDTQAYADYTIRYGEHYTVTVGSGKNRRTETRTRWYVDSGSIASAFDDVQIEASRMLETKQLATIGGFDSGNSVRYHSQYVAGYDSERYSTGLDESWQSAQDIIVSRLRAQIVARYHADVVDYVRIHPSYDQTTYKYVLVPIWAIHYTYRKKQYGCIVNGRNRRVAGKYPLSVWKVGITSLFGAGLLALLGWLIASYVL